MCEFCNNEKNSIVGKINDDDNWLLRREPSELYLQDNKLILFIRSFRRNIYNEINIKYCPMCGRKLE